MSLDENWLSVPVDDESVEVGETVEKRERMNVKRPFANPVNDENGSEDDDEEEDEDEEEEDDDRSLRDVFKESILKRNDELPLKNLQLESFIWFEWMQSDCSAVVTGCSEKR